MAMNTHYCVDTFRLQLMNTFAYFLIMVLNQKSKYKFGFRQVQVVVHHSASLSFGKENTKLLDVLSLVPYFKSTS
jgi:hypothetical protein